MYLPLTDKGLHRYVSQHQFNSRHPAFLVRGRYKRLAHDSDEQACQAGLSKVPLLNRKEVNDAVNRLRSTGSVARGQYQVPGLSQDESSRSRLRIPHFTDHYYIRV